MGSSKSKTKKTIQTTCYHCGEGCNSGIVQFDEKSFCCDGCKLVYDLLRENNLCTYYSLNSTPGLSRGESLYLGQYEHLDNEKIFNKLVRFTNENHTHISFYIPNIHCNSCIWLLENLHRLNKEITNSNVNFLRKEVTVIYNSGGLKLSEVAALLAHIGYEPQISLNDMDTKQKKGSNKKQVIKIGIAGFCFGNIMMLSFPEYFSLGNFYEHKNLVYLFGYLNLFLSLPVLFYCSSDFFVSAWKSIRHRYLNIDAPIALAILVTFLRSIYEIISNTGTGYMDSMSGIVFFMLIGRYFQNRTYDTLSFDRDYKSYFPIGVTLKREDRQEINVPVSELQTGDHIIIRNNEIIPSDATLISDQTFIDYSFITGESAPVQKQRGELIYAGGKQLYGAIELEIKNPVSQSYLTQLWNKEHQQQEQAESNQSYVDKINKYFTIVVFIIASIASLYWLMNDTGKILNAITAVLIIACPCGLLLTATFANGNILRIYGRNKFYLKNPAVIEKLCKTDTIVFDKTGTITKGSSVKFSGRDLSAYESELMSSLAAQSSHPLSRKIHSTYATGKPQTVTKFTEITGKGIKGYIDGKKILLGSEYFITGCNTADDNFSAKVFLKIEEEIIGFFSIENAYRKGLNSLINSLGQKFHLKLLSGDNDAEKKKLENIFGPKANLHFNQKPEEKMHHVKIMQQQGHRVMMLGDGLNDAGALKQSDVGISISDDTNNFSPACDAILDGSSFNRIPAFMSFARAGKKVIIFTFILSLIYNIIGLGFAVQGILSPVVAAILMPASSISIVLLTTISTNIIAKVKDL